MSVVKKHLTALDVVSAGDGLYAQQVNYGLGTTIKSLADVVTRHFEDYNLKFVEDKVFDGFVISDAGSNNISVSAGNASVKGVWHELTSTATVVIPAGVSETYYVVLTTRGDGGTDETRNPLNDAVQVEAVTSANFSGTIQHPIGKVVNDGAGVVATVTDFGALFTRRMDSIKPKAGSKITVYTGTHPDATQENFMFSGTSVLLRNDNGGYWGGAGDDFNLYHDATDNIFNNINGGLHISYAGTPKYTFTSSVLGLTGNLIVSGTSNLIGAVSVSGALLVDDTLTVTGALAVSGAMLFDDDLTVLGNTGLSGTAILNSTLNVLGAVTNQSTTNTIGASSFSGAMLIDDTLNVLSTFSASGASVIDDTLKVTGVFTASGASTHQGHATFDQNIILTGELQGASIISGTNIFGTQLSGTSIVTNGTLSVSGASLIDDSLTVLGAFGSSGAVNFDSTLAVKGTSNFIGASSFSGAILVDDTFTALSVGRFESDLYVNGNGVYSGTSGFSGAVIVDDTFNSTGIATFDTTIIAGGEIQGASLISGTNIFGSQLSGTSIVTDGTLNVSGATVIDDTLSVLGTFGLTTGTTITEISTDNTLASQSDNAVVTENAIRDFVFGTSGTLASEISTASGVVWAQIGTASGALRSDVDTNATGISGNDTDISTNASGISANLALINAYAVSGVANVDTLSLVPNPFDTNHSSVDPLMIFSQTAGYWSVATTASSGRNITLPITLPLTMGSLSLYIGGMGYRIQGGGDVSDGYIHGIQRRGINSAGTVADISTTDTATSYTTGNKTSSFSNYVDVSSYLTLWINLDVRNNIGTLDLANFFVYYYYA